MNENENNSPAQNRRDFLKNGSFATMMAMMGGVELFARDAMAAEGEAKATTTRVKVAVIGLGTWGREIISTLALLPQAEIAVVCDTYPAACRRAAKEAPDAKQLADYQTILEDKDVRAVIVATPTHLHKEPALAAIKAGKHVYCEAPLANTIEDAKAIAVAAKGSPQLVFQAGLQMRSDPQRHFLLPFIRSGALGQIVMARAQWHKKNQWRSPAPTPEREQALNWRLNKAVSLGLVGEQGSHQLDQASWFLNANPVAVSGFGSVQFWKDGRDVPDTVQALVEYPGGIYLTFDATLANSFDSSYEMFYGSDAAVMLRGSKAWMFKEVDSPLLGWEIYARKDKFYEETGIALVANASKSVQAVDPAAENPLRVSQLHFALDSFLRNVGDLLLAEEAYKASYGTDDPLGMAEALAKVPRRASAGYVEGFRAAVTAVKANEAINSGGRVEMKPEWYELV